MAYKEIFGFEEERKQIKGFWKPKNVGDTFEGILRRVLHNRGKYRNRNMYLFENENGEIIGVMGNTVLDKIFNKNLDICLNKKVKIEYHGLGLNKNNVKYHLFRVFVDE